METTTTCVDSSIIRDSIVYAKKKLGISTLKPQQEKAFESMLRGHDVFMGLPTGYGKSVVFQGAAFCSEYIKRIQEKDDSNFVVVVMPLKALIKDQLTRAGELGIAAADISSGLTDELREQISGQASGKTQAFCGSYGQLGEIRSTLPSVPVIAMTATATTEARKQITHSLAMRNYATIVESPDKPN
ncbi:ATP-dependent DNA helicase RecQ-like [Lytechinus variegatus]|uniref:ATP-dependent DNA helicase RecQ-like n=1 Tax=Lytechinus variegatus TaxID=7654 RepID=UPI001BB1BCA6|nr:ATP-dependent DNA helicase RecQ-like [Lytechinus variegatus]